MSIDIDAFDAIAAKIQDKLGEGAIHDASDTPYVSRLSFGSHELNYATGGGAPIGRVTRLYGAPSSGKSLACWNLIKSAQNVHITETARLTRLLSVAQEIGDKEAEKWCKDELKLIKTRWPKGMLCVYYNVEKQMDKRLLQRLGIDTDRLKVVQKSTIEDVGAIMESLLGVAHVHVVDSLSSAVPQDELAGNIGDWHIGLKARVWGKVLRRMLERFDNHDNCVVLVDQVRAVMGGNGGEEPPGGRAIEHASDMTIHFKRGGWLFRDKDGVLDRDGEKETTLSGTMEPEGMEIKARVMKSRVGQPFRTANMHLDFGTMEYDRYFELLKGAKHFGMVDVSGGWYKLPDGTKIQGKAKFRKFMESDPDFCNAVADKMHAVSMV